MDFPIDLSDYAAVSIDLSQERLTKEQKEALSADIRLVRDVIVFVTGYASAKGLGGHTGGAYDLVPEYVLLEAARRSGAPLFPTFFDEAGHRAAIHYVMAALDEGRLLSTEDLLHYREHGWGLHGHPERDEELGVGFSSGRLGHLWSYVNGVSLADPEHAVILFGSDGSQQEGDDAEAARFAVAQRLKVKLLIDDNDTTITGKPSDYLPGFSVEKTLAGHGLAVKTTDPEDLDALFAGVRWLLATDGPAALVNRRAMAPGVKGIEGTTKGHDAISPGLAIEHLRGHGQEAAAKLLEAPAKKTEKKPRLGSSQEQAKNRDEFGKIVADILEKMTPAERKEKVIIIDSDLAGSCGLHHLQKRCPDVYIAGGIMERNNFSAAAGFGSEPGRQGIFATFSAFLEMLVSEITMARLNNANVLAHFSHAGIDEMSDNTCHFGISNLFADNGLGTEDTTRLYRKRES